MCYYCVIQGMSNVRASFWDELTGGMGGGVDPLWGRGGMYGEMNDGGSQQGYGAQGAGQQGQGGLGGMGGLYGGGRGGYEDEDDDDELF